ncbi:HD-GYP domain-containing protein [Deinococcus sp. UYEF24]
MNPIRRSRTSLAVAVAVPVSAGVLTLLLPLINPALHLYTLHAALVGTVAVLALILALLMGQVGIRQRNLQVVLLSLAFASLALVYGVHGLATPEMSMPGMHLGPNNRVLPAASQLGALLTAFWLYMSSLATDSRALQVLQRARRVLISVWTVALVGLGALTFLPQVAAVLVPAGPVARWVLAIITLALALSAAWRYWQSWRYSRFPLQLAIVYAACWLAGAQVIISLGPAWTVSWWLYHVLLVGVTSAILVGLVMQQRQPRMPLGTVLHGLWNNHPDDLLAAGISVSVQRLVLETERHDPYTAGHSYRVALHALRLARELGLEPEALRAVTQGGILHDLGKLDVAREVLNSPSRLTPEEWDTVEGHPVYGYERCRRLGYLPEELGIVRSHHEKWDGTGYPDRLAGEDIPLLARIMTIADVYDALTSRRSYREPWTHLQANAHIAEQSGALFDPELVRVWLRLRAPELHTDQLPDWATPKALPVRLLTAAR